MQNLVLETIHARRSTRAFSSAQIDTKSLEILLDAATWAPTGMGKQLWQFTAIHNAEKNLELAKTVAKALERGEDYNFYGAPTSILVSYQRDENHAFLDGSAAVQNVLLAATSIGLDTCWINQIRVCCDDPAVRALLRSYGVPDDHIIIASIAVGHGTKTTAPKPRRDGCVRIVE